MTNLWKNPFEASEMEAPYNIIKKQCDFLRDGTDGKIIAKIVEFDGLLFRNLILGYWNKQANANNKLYNQYKSVDFDVSNKFTYEFYITSTSALKFKYRILLIQYGISFYPSIILIDDDVKDDLLTLSKVLVSNKHSEFLNNLEKVINSKTVSNVISNLLSFINKTEP